ncbi:hypothetical protein FRC17_002198 [Serendipita sp. 399]|nr:hypothetical protein FRC17_002198 [Serendipita sp. 399]
MTSTYFQPPSGSSGSRTIYSVRNSRSSQRTHDTNMEIEDQQAMQSPTPSEYSFSSGSGSSYAPSDPASTPNSPTPCGAPLMDEIEGENGGEIEFDATDEAQLDAFVPKDLLHAIDAARYSSYGDFGDEICWEALPSTFGPLQSPPQNGSSTIHSMMMDSQLAHRLLLIHTFIYGKRYGIITFDELCLIACETNLPIDLIIQYLGVH